MQNYTACLTKLQTFTLRIRTQLANNSQPERIYYELKHETPYYDSFSFKSELRVLRDMAVVELINLDNRQLQLQIAQAEKLRQRFKTFWINYQNNYNGWERTYERDYILSIRLHELFIVHNLQSTLKDILIIEDFVDDLAESVKLREQILDGLLKQANSLLVCDQGSADKPDNDMIPVVSMVEDSIGEPSASSIVRTPAFTAGTTEALYTILKSYFSPADQERLYALITGNYQPETTLVFNGNGNQLADAFKQLYEANLVVGCSKGEMEEWMASNFEYVYRGQQKKLPVSYLNSIISSNTKPCQSPILDVKKQADGMLIIIPVSRTQRGS
ncbi:hypothetical protein HH214_07490 [Mucilaginibacter robiniae]|uniref:Uncharacterized protein n=1 Tax=Mucilaginibacter robiniae TaxID=2728022 RepID=A0A7L5E5V0_9SPHI|nr:hypothetical protein [Mucilaginibacter robiniae]QJD95726.1 hypothetical protein HH214_07490 [Mucilaginibacter robiniae]